MLSATRLPLRVYYFGGNSTLSVKSCFYALCKVQFESSVRDEGNGIGHNLWKKVELKSEKAEVDAVNQTGFSKWINNKKTWQILKAKFSVQESNVYRKPIFFNKVP